MKITNRLTVVGGSLALALVLAACGGSDTGAGTAEPTTGAGTSATEDATVTEEASEAHNDSDTAFAQNMIVHHEGAIEMADLAVERAASEDVRALGERISAAQGPEIETMTSWLDMWGEDTGPMTEEMPGMDHGDADIGMDQEEGMSELESLSGTEFDRRFLELMIEHHNGAVSMAETEVSDGQNGEAVALAEKIIEDQLTEIAEMEQMLQAL